MARAALITAGARILREGVSRQAGIRMMSGLSWSTGLPWADCLGTSTASKTPSAAVASRSEVLRFRKRRNATIVTELLYS